jgi:hypothetical protein
MLRLHRALQPSARAWTLAMSTLTRPLRLPPSFCSPMRTSALPLAPSHLPALHLWTRRSSSSAAPLSPPSPPLPSPTPSLQPPPSWIDRAPRALQPYLHLVRLDKPIGTWLLFWPCAWSIALAAPAGHAPDVALIALFGAGAVLMRGAGCTINDLWDKDIDAKACVCLYDRGNNWRSE